MTFHQSAMQCLAIACLFAWAAPALAQGAEPGEDETPPTLMAVQLELAGDNAGELTKALDKIAPQRREAIAYLIMTMPERDLTTVTADYLVRNTDLAYEAWQNAPWHEKVTKQQFLQYILPFATLNERRDDWRADFYKQLREKCWEFDNPLDAVNWLNANLNDHFKVYFHATKRPKADQSPYESIEAGYASCTGMSILLTDACRAVGIPARIVGIPVWAGGRGNHNWVEVFGDRWYNVGGTKSDVRDDKWVNKRTKEKSDPDHWLHSVYATCHRPTATRFPLVWDLSIDYVPALNVTRFYSEPTDVTVAIPGGGEAEVFIYWAGELVARKTGTGQIVTQLAASSQYKVVFHLPDASVQEHALKTD